MENILINLLESYLTHTQSPYYDRHVVILVTDYLRCKEISPPALFPNASDSRLERGDYNEGAIGRLGINGRAGVVPLVLWTCNLCQFVVTHQSRQNHIVYDCIELPRQCLPCGIHNCTREELLLHHDSNCGQDVITCDCCFRTFRLHLDNHYRFSCPNVSYCKPCDCFFHPESAVLHKSICGNIDPPQIPPPQIFPSTTLFSRIKAWFN
jgi:hypothetical protein